MEPSMYTCIPIFDHLWYRKQSDLSPGDEISIFYHIYISICFLQGTRRIHAAGGYSRKNKKWTRHILDWLVFGVVSNNAAVNYFETTQKRITQAYVKTIELCTLEK